MSKILVEGIVVGFVMMAVGLPSGLLASKILPVVNNNHVPVMYLSLFLTGFSAHMLLELAKVNKWYCTNGVACS